MTACAPMCRSVPWARSDGSPRAGIFDFCWQPMLVTIVVVGYVSHSMFCLHHECCIFSQQQFNYQKLQCKHTPWHSSVGECRRMPSQTYLSRASWCRGVALLPSANGLSLLHPLKLSAITPASSVDRQDPLFTSDEIDL